MEIMEWFMKKAWEFQQIVGLNEFQLSAFNVKQGKELENDSGNIYIANYPFTVHGLVKMRCRITHDPAKIRAI